MITRWTPVLATGFPTIDEEHQGLFDLVNELQETQNASLPRESVTWVIGRLKDYAQVHFMHEEDLMARYAFPEAEAHQRLHRAFIQKVLDLEDRHAHGNRVLVSDMLDFLKHWLVAHISEQDMRYVGWVKSH